MSEVKTNSIGVIGTRYFKSNSVSFAPTSKVDKENGILYDVILCEAGEAKGHGVFLEESFIEDVVSLAGKNPVGLKCRFGHPTMSSEALGTYVGRITNVRLQDGNKAIGDLHLDPSAKLAPGGDLYSYVLELASSSPISFGLSIVFKSKELYQYDSEGKKVVIEEDGSNYNSQEKLYISIDSLFGCDLVDAGAATSSLFESKLFNNHSYAVKLSNFLDENQELYEFVSNNPEVIEKFISRYNEFRKGKSKLSLTEETATTETPEEVPAPSTTTPEVNTEAPDGTDTPETPEEDDNSTHKPHGNPSVPAAEPSSTPHATEEPADNALSELKQSIVALQENQNKILDKLKEFGLSPAATHTEFERTDVVQASGEMDFSKNPWNLPRNKK